MGKLLITVMTRLERSQKKMSYFDDVSMTRHDIRRVEWRPNSDTRIRFESHPGDEGPFVPRHHGEHYPIELKPSNLSWKQTERNNLTIKVQPGKYEEGHGTGFLPGEKHPGI